MSVKTKDIYIIRNTVNDMVYVGQTSNAPERWSKHVYEAKVARNGMLINEAMHDLGIDKFYYQILESNVSNYHERERYWISQYNCMYPNGYNTLAGGIVSGLESPSAKLTKESLARIIELLQFSGFSNAKIAKECNCGEWTIWAINNGQAYYDPDLKYPLRKSNRYTKELIKQVKYALKYEYDKSIQDIAKEFNVDPSQVSEINQGKIHNFSNETYPLRSGKTKNVISQEIVDSIKSDLKNTTMTQTDIAKTYNVSNNCVSGINMGRNFRDDNENYPIRDNHRSTYNNTKNHLTIPMVAMIERDILSTTLSMRKIAKKYDVGLTTVQNINNGSLAAYRKSYLMYPLRSIN